MISMVLGVAMACAVVWGIGLAGHKVPVVMGFLLGFIGFFIANFLIGGK